MKIVFMGTPGFAVPALSALIDAGYTIAGVVTAPDRPAGRGQKLHESEVKKFALEKGLNILQPEKLKNPDFIRALQKLKPDLQVVVAFRMLPETVWNLPPKGTINLHASLLPQYRGAAPINHAIINGEHETGVTTFFLKHEIDTGDIIFSAKVPVKDSDTAGELHDALMHTGAALLVKTVKAIETGSYIEQPQPASQTFKHAPKLSKEFCRIQWNAPIEKIYNHIRGLSPYPAAFTTLNDKTLKIFKAEKEYAQHNAAPGTFTTDKKTYLKFAGTDGYLKLTDIQLEGKKRMQVEELLRGLHF